MHNKANALRNFVPLRGQLAGEAIVEVVENQMADNNPPETKDALERLIKNGESKENTMRYIVSVLSIEIFGALNHEESYQSRTIYEKFKSTTRTAR